MLKVRAVIRSTWRMWLARYITWLCRQDMPAPWMLQWCVLRSLQVCLNERRMLAKEKVVDYIANCVAEVKEWVKQKINV